MRAKLGLVGAEDGDFDLATALFAAMEGQGVDFTLLFRALAGEDGEPRALFADPAGFDAWLPRWRERLGGGKDAAAMNAANPLYIPRNHMVEAALDAAWRDDNLGPFEALLEAVRNPYAERPGQSAYARPAPEGFGPYVTFCGT